MFGYPQLPPHRILTVALMAAAVAVAIVVGTALSPPWLGLQLQGDGDAVVVVHVHPAVTAHPLRRGDRIVAVYGADGVALPVGARELTPEPDMAFSRYSQMDAFFERQTLLARALQAPGASVRLHDGRVKQIPVRDSRPLASLPVAFWFQLLCALGGLLAGASVWAFRPRDPATTYYATTGIGMLLFAASAAIYSTREFVIDGQLFMVLSALNQFGALLFCGGLIAVLWYYPTQLAPWRAGPVIVGTYVATGLAIPLRLVDSVEALAHLPITLGYLSTYGLAAVQWRRTRRDPLQRAALRAFLLAWLFGSGAFVAVMIVPAMFGIDNGALQGYAFGFFLLIYAGIAAGVLRYQLFRLDRWWFTAWRLFFGGLAVIALDLLFIYVLRLDARSSLLISLALAGWLYFPLRLWLWKRLTTRGGNPQQALIRRVTESLADKDRGELDAWRSLLENTFAPLAVEALDVVEDAVAESGLALKVAAHEGLPGLRLQFCARGDRLFGQDDLRTLRELRHLFREILRYRGMLEAAVARERRRVARDLHDDVGARLLTMSHRLPPEQAEQARQALAELRAVVHSMQAPPMSLRALLSQWQDELEERCIAAGVALDWSLEGELPELELAGGEALSLTRVLREALSNALRHAAPDRIALRLNFRGTRLSMQLRHRHHGPAPEQWTASLGLHSLRSRLAPLRGEISWIARDGELHTDWHAELAANSPTDPAFAG